MATFVLNYANEAQGVTIDVPGDSATVGGVATTLQMELADNGAPNAGAYSAETDFFDLTGSAQADTFIAGNGGSKLTGGAGGGDTLTGGNGEDQFFYAGGEQVFGEIIAGGAGNNDAIVMSGGSPNIFTGFGNATISGVERVVFEADQLGIGLLTSQVGAGGITQFVGPGGGEAGLVGLGLDSPQAFDINALSFVNWDDEGFHRSIEISGSDGNDTITGHATLLTRLDGGLGADILTGGAADDLFGFGGGVELAAGEAIDGKGGFDMLFFYLGGNCDFSQTTLTNVETLFIDTEDSATFTFKSSQLGEGALAELSGGDAIDLIVKGGKVDLSDVDISNLGATLTVSILGSATDNRLTGSDEADSIRGGLGQDAMKGGGGGDEFLFLTDADSGNSGKSRDRIADFKAGVDTIDVSAIDADGDAANGNTAFSFLPGKHHKFTGAGAELRWFQINEAGKSHDKTIVAFDMDGDKKSDFQIELAGLKVLAAGDFDL